MIQQPAHGERARPDPDLPEPAASHGRRHRRRPAAAAVGGGRARVLLPGRVLQLPARRRGARLRHRAVHQGLHHLVRPPSPPLPARPGRRAGRGGRAGVPGEPVGREAADRVRRDAVLALGHRHRARRRRRDAGGVRELALRHRRRLRLRGWFSLPPKKGVDEFR